MYADKLDGLIDAALFQTMSNQWREEQDRCRRDTERHRNADRSYLSEGWRFSNWPTTRSAYSRSKNRAKSVASSISCYRTAHGMTAY
jgi:hypothetical protein